MGSGPDTLIRGPIKNTVYVFPDVVGSVKMLITFKGKSMGNGPYNIFRGFENAYKTCPHQQKSDTKATIVVTEVLERSLIMPLKTSL